ncbi:hypothetical protein CDAR_431691 [Caerostris darwini]|uniref:Uncharacterized protein n=1 Tax=Caerostris darwini TaxID=1538125 RepID=A0AAV4SUG0_9ARAC|nr:hypothetical protein CDAR_431691 [Caerostris darwini]
MEGLFNPLLLFGTKVGKFSTSRLPRVYVRYLKPRAIKLNSILTISEAIRRSVRNEQPLDFTKRPTITIPWLDYPNSNGSASSLCSFAEPTTNHLPGEVGEIDLVPFSCPGDYGPIPLEHSLRRDTWIEF